MGGGEEGDGGAGVAAGELEGLGEDRSGGEGAGQEEGEGEGEVCERGGDVGRVGLRGWGRCIVERSESDSYSVDEE